MSRAFFTGSAQPQELIAFRKTRPAEGERASWDDAPKDAIRKQLRINNAVFVATATHG